MSHCTMCHAPVEGPRFTDLATGSTMHTTCFAPGLGLISRPARLVALQARRRRQYAV
jgi:hypothetical protein